MSRLSLWLASRLSEEDGQGLSEYSLILALIAVVAVVVLSVVGNDVTDYLMTAATSV
jgi:Flp pilus assembly pilin Flp